jgi:predicted ATPase
VLGVTSFWCGRFPESRTQFERALAGYRPDAHPAHLKHFAQDPKVICLVRLALTLWYLGHPDQAATVAEEALALGEQLGHPFSLGYAMWFAVRVAEQRREDERVQELRAAAARFTEEHRLSFRYEPLAAAFDGWVRVRQGDAGGLDRLRDGLARSSASDQTFHMSLTQRLLAEAHLRCGQPEAAIEVVRDALHWCRTSGQRYQEAELHRIHAEAAIARGTGDAEVGAALGRSLAVARAQAARSLELRAATRLARWRLDTGTAADRARARRTLERVHGWFTEGHATRDLRDAAELLDRLR